MGSPSYMRKYYMEHRDAIREQGAQYRKLHKDSIHKRHAVYYSNIRASHNERMRKYYYKNREGIRIKQAQYQNLHKDAINRQKAKYYSNKDHVRAVRQKYLSLHKHSKAVAHRKYYLKRVARQKAAERLENERMKIDSHILDLLNGSW